MVSDCESMTERYRLGSMTVSIPVRESMTKYRCLGKYHKVQRVKGPRWACFNVETPAK